jgi:DNA-binding SARP family transcriptional activator
LASHHTRQGAPEKAVYYWERLAGETPYDDHANLQLVSTLTLQRHIEAERHFQKYMDLLRAEGLEPSPNVTGKYHALVQGVPAA